jgi:hypothetical protein
MRLLEKMKNMRKQLFALTILCILAVTSVTVLLTVPAKADSSDAKVLSFRWYVAPYGGNAYSEGDLVVVGEIENNGTSNIAYMYVTAAAYSNGTLLAQSSPTQVFGNNLKQTDIAHNAKNV